MKHSTYQCITSLTGEKCCALLTLETVSAGLHCSFRMSRHIDPLEFMLGWYTFVWKLTCTRDRFTTMLLGHHVQQMQAGRDITGGAHGSQGQLGRVCQVRWAAHLGRLEGVIRREVNLHHEDTARVWAIRRSAA